MTLSPSIEKQKERMLYPHRRLLERLDAISDEHDYNVKELANYLDISPGNLYNIRSGQQPGLDVCLQIAEKLNEPIEVILWEAGRLKERPVRRAEDIPPKWLKLIETLLNKSEAIQSAVYKMLSALAGDDNNDK